MGAKAPFSFDKTTAKIKIMKQELSISPKSIVWFFGSLLAIFMLWYIRDVIFLFFIVLLLFAAFNPLVNALERHHIPRFFSVITIYIIFLFVLALIIYAFIPPVVRQLQLLSEYLPTYFSQFKEILIKTQHFNFLNQGVQNSLDSLAQSLSQLSQSAWAGVVSVFGGIVSFLVIVVASFYLLLYKSHFRQTILKLFPRKQRKLIRRILRRVVEKLGAWTLGEIVLCVIVGAITFIALSILKVKFALLLALLAGILEIIPAVGPVLAAIPAVAIALLVSPWQAFGVIVSYVIIQQVENHFLVPLVMRRAINLNPVLTIFALLVGAKLGGILGAIIAIPMLAVILVIWEEIVSDL